MQPSSSGASACVSLPPRGKVDAQRTDEGQSSTSYLTPHQSPTATTSPRRGRLACPLTVILSRMHARRENPLVCCLRGMRTRTLCPPVQGGQGGLSKHAMNRHNNPPASQARHRLTQVDLALGQQFCVHMQNCQLMRARTPHRGAAHDARIRPLHREGYPPLTLFKGKLLFS